ncbi:hypothetical protein B7P43_G07023 [Cryptotermes secundus]|uniref:PiggyBac transposable element-derived protein domain-containing protein n=1 Tax=Cryptotermes secundus TaxID=105785 RepID=A0A2J7PEP6_9NEOP|nr:hypothetical protein B7P43_G07023 [Cryptotermes secundus]
MDTSWCATSRRRLRNTALNDAYQKYYNPSEHLSVDEIIVKFKGRLKKGDIRDRVRGDMTALVWKDKRDKPAIVADYKHMGCVDKADGMTNSYSISHRTWKWTNQLFFHLLDLTILNSFVMLSCWGAKLSHRDFCLTLVRNMLEPAARGPPRPQRPIGRPPALSSTICRLGEAN